MISNKIFKKIQIKNDKIYGLNNQLLLITDNKEEILKDSVYDFAVCDTYIWNSFLNKITLFHIVLSYNSYFPNNTVQGNPLY